MISFYWAIIAIVICSVLAMFISARYATCLKHQYDDKKPKFDVTEGHCYATGALFGSIGLIISFFCFKEIPYEQRLNHYRFLWVSLAELVIQAVVIVILFHYNVLTFTVA